MMCRKLGLVGGGTVAVDGSRFKAVNTRDKNYTPGAIRLRMDQVDASITRYLQMLDTADRQEEPVAQMRVSRLNDRLEALRRQMRQLRTMEEAVAAAPDHQISLTDPDARAMATNGKGTGLVGYNVQAAVDEKHHLIVAHEVTNIGHDRTQLANMARQAKEATGSDRLTVLADRGYFSGVEVIACEEAGVTPIVPKPLTSSGTKRGFFSRPDFVYDAEHDHYTCPAGAKLTKAHRRADHSEDLDFYRHLNACFTCPLRPHCTPTKQAYQALGTRGGDRGDAAAAGREARCHARPTQHRRARLRHDQGLDGAEPLSNTKARRRRNRNEPPCPGLQPETRHRRPRNPGAHRSDPGMRRVNLLTTAQPERRSIENAFSHLWTPPWAQEKSSSLYRA